MLAADSLIFLISDVHIAHLYFFNNIRFLYIFLTIVYGAYING